MGENPLTRYFAFELDKSLEKTHLVYIDMSGKDPTSRLEQEELLMSQNRSFLKDSVSMQRI